MSTRDIKMPTGNGVKYLPEPEEEEVVERRVKVGSMSDNYSDKPCPNKPYTFDLGEDRDLYQLSKKNIVVILNGPPGCGKDTLAKEINVSLNVNLCSMKKPMFELVLSASGISREDWFDRYDNRDLKEEPWVRLGGLSCREFMIKISEEWVKPIFGNDHFGRLACNQCSDTLDIFTDGGFQEEFHSIVKEFGRRNVRLVRLHREGITFEGDSRDYIDEEGCKCLDLKLKDGDIDGGVAALKEFILN